MAPASKSKYKEPARYDHVVKSPNDNRSYRGLVLHNKLKVLLISDPSTDKSAASLDVNVGYSSDPKEFPGLAHFYEHVLYYGSSKYPELNDYSHYLSLYGGSYNAATYVDHTNYYFDVHPERLDGALDRFSQFFITPLFSESAIDMETTNLEHEKYYADYIQRFDQLERFSADPNYAYSKFGIETKQKSSYVRNELLNFHKNYYSANVMSLSVLGKENLDELEKKVVEMFSDIENKEVKAPRREEQPFKEEYYSTKFYVVPIKDVRNLHLMFPIPNLQEHYRAAPVHYWSYLIRHQGKGSLYSVLREKGWCNSLNSGRRYSARGYYYYSVYYDLTEAGFQHVDDIISMTYQYINMLKKEGPVKRVYEEYRDIANINFHYEEKYSPKYYVQSTARHLQNYPMEEVLSAPHRYTEWRPDLITDFAQYLVPEKMRVHVTAKTYEAMADSVEPYYGTKYKKEKISDDTIQKWNNAGYYESFYYPEKNEFIPSKFNVKPYEQQAEKYPYIIQDSPYIRVWYKQDDVYHLPKASMYFDFVSPVAYVDPVSCNMTHIFVQLFRDSCYEYAYYAKSAGVNWDCYNSKYGFRMTLTGYDHKMEEMLEKVFNYMITYKVDEKRFQVIKENYVRWLQNFEVEQPYEHGTYYLESILTEQFWNKNELMAYTSMITAERVQHFIQHFMSKMHIEYLIHGNVTKSEAVHYAHIVESKFTAFKEYTPLLPEQMLLHRVHELPNGHHYVYEIENKYYNKFSYTQVYYQYGLQSTENNMLLELFAQIIYEPFHHTMHPKEHIGNIVHSGIYRKNGVQGFRVVVQNYNHPEYIEKKIEEFMQSMLQYIKSMSDEEFYNHKESVATRRQVRPKMMYKQTEYYWREITMQQYNFDRVSTEVAYLKTITRDQMVKFYEYAVNSKSKYHRRLSVYGVPTAQSGSNSAQKTAYSEVTCRKEKSSEKAQEGAVKINDVLYFKSNHSLYPLVEPYNNVPRKGCATVKQYVKY